MRLVSLDGSAYLGLLKYEQLPTFCFLCGLIGHRHRNCPKAKGNYPDVNAMEYGSWMDGVDRVLSSKFFLLRMLLFYPR